MAQKAPVPGSWSREQATVMQDNGLPNLFAITRFRCIEVPFHVFYYYSRVNKIVLYIEDFVILRGGGGEGLLKLKFYTRRLSPDPLP